MACSSSIKQKRYALDEAKLKQAQKLPGAKTEAETIERTLEEAISEHERQRRDRAATERSPQERRRHQRCLWQARRSGGIVFVRHPV